MDSLFFNARYINGINGTPVAVVVNVGDTQIMTVPIDPANTDYQNIMQLVAEGKLTIAPAGA